MVVRQYLEIAIPHGAAQKIAHLFLLRRCRNIDVTHHKGSFQGKDLFKRMRRTDETADHEGIPGVRSGNIDATRHTDMLYHGNFVANTAHATNLCGLHIASNGTCRHSLVVNQVIAIDKDVLEMHGLSTIVLRESTHNTTDSDTIQAVFDRNRSTVAQFRQNIGLDSSHLHIPD